MSRTLRRRSRVVAGTTLAAALAAAGIATATDGSAAPATTSAKPTIVLVHGAFADASGFSQEVKMLQRSGYNVIAPAISLRSVTGDAAYVRSVITGIKGPVVVVAHSYGGAVATNAARGLTKVRALVYLAAFVPDTGQSLASILATYPGSELGPATIDIRPYTDPDEKGGKGADITIKPADFRAVFAGDQSAATAAELAAVQRPLSETAFAQPSGTPAWKTIPSWDLVTLDDKAIPPAAQEAMAAHAGAHVTTVRSAHDVMISHPQAVVTEILRAVTATTPKGK